jgi:hypothetical protein
MDLIPAVSLAIAIFAYVVALGVSLMLFVTALAKWSVDFFKDV